ncbi:MAG: major facilitator superfamily 1 [Chloroflexi bacterium]|nr:major facilitator superfamily 1 [Chloroflexota bacterium]
MTHQRFAALQHHDFRLYWIGFVISISGQQMLWMLEPWLIYELSGSTVYLGINALAQAIPATALVLIGGVIADKFDQRKLLIGVQIAYVALLSLIAGLALTELLEVWHILVLAFIKSALGSFENPARQSLFPHLIPRDLMPNAVALNATIHPGTRIGAPVVGGFLLALTLGATGSPRIAAGCVMLIGIAGIAVYTVMLAMIHVPPITRAKSGGMVSDMAEGVRFIWRNPVFAFLIGLAYFHMFFGYSVGVMFPVIAKDVLHVGPDALGIMWSAMGAGSLAGVFLAAYLSAVRHQRAIITWGQVAMGGGMIAFALTPLYWLSMALLFVVGAGASVLNVAIQQNLQMLVPNQLRGRVIGVWSMVHSSIRPMGEMQFSGVAALVSAPFALILSGAVVVAAAAFFAIYGRPIRALVNLREAALTDPAARTDAAHQVPSPSGSPPSVPSPSGPSGRGLG